jgi:hypothetical protein
MPLDIWIYGPGFGESILLMWDVEADSGGTERRAAFIDCYGGPDYESHRALRQWRSAGCPEVALACITHPHLDHIQHASVMMEAAGCNADCILWWGGHTLDRTLNFFAQMREDLSIKNQELGVTADMTWRFLNDLSFLHGDKHGCRDKEKGKPHIKTPMGVTNAYTGSTIDGPLEIYAIGPWLGPQTTYTRWIDSRIFVTPHGHAAVRPGKGVANCTSLGFLIRHGNAQVLLGGDMEVDNWTQLEKALENCDDAELLPALDPCVIKASHHGSSSGVIKGMWNAGSGFFDSIKNGSGEPPHCVITPWRRGAASHHLPDPKVIEQIAQAGCHVWETAVTEQTGIIDKATRLVDSCIHFTIDPETNRVKEVKSHLCKHTVPPTTDRASS